MGRQRTLIIYDTKESGSGLSFDLVDLLDLLSPMSIDAVWTVSSDDEEFWAIGDGGAALEQLATKSATVSGAKLLALARNTQQVVWGTFTGFLSASKA